MKILLDTHIILWALTDDKKLSEKANAIILAKENKLFYSTAVVWEVTIKHILHPGHMQLSGRQVSDYCQKAGYQMLPIRDEHVYMLENIHRAEDAPKHKDPFDRIMLAQAKAEDMSFVTHDSLMPYYNEKCIVFV